MTQLFYSIYPHVLFNAHVRWCCVLDKWCLINKVCLITRVCSKWSNFGNFQIKIQFTVSNKFLPTDAWSKKFIYSFPGYYFICCLFLCGYYSRRIFLWKAVSRTGRLHILLTASNRATTIWGQCLFLWEGRVYFFGRAGFILLRASDYMAAIGGGIYSKKYVQ